MARATVHGVCKHCNQKFTIEKTFYSRKEADAWEAYIGNKLDCCSSCYRHASEAENERKNKELLSKVNLPRLEGSEKQIAWATSIRKKFYLNNTNICLIAKHWTDGIKKQKEKEIKMYKRYSIQHRIAERALKLESETSAVWWIEHRDYL